MNVYLIGMIISMIAYIVIGFFVSKKVKSAEDYYVAGRRAPVLLLAGSLIASYVGTGLFMGDAAWCYEGGFPVGVPAVLTLTGCVLGVILFGRFLRRIKVFTIPEYFGKRFQSKAIEKIASIICIVTMGVYTISVTQGIGTLMHAVTGLDQNLCMFLSMVVFTFVAIVGGSNGVLITDTIMSAIFLSATVIGVFFIMKAGGGITQEIATITHNPETAGFFTPGGAPGYHYGTPLKNMTWAGFTFLVWFGVCATSPWQASRYLMAKNENTAIRAAVPCMIGVVLLHYFIDLSGALVKALEPNLPDPSQALIWASMNVMPTFVGVLSLTGVLAAGISSATTFLSQIGANVTRDFCKNSKHPIRTGRIAMFVTAALVIIYTLTTPPSVFWIMMLGGAIIASAFLPTGIASVFSKRLTKQAAIAGMSLGFLASFGIKIYTSLTGASLPLWADSNVIGIVTNTIVMIVVSLFTKVTPEEKAIRESLFIIPEAEKDPEDMRRTLRWVKSSLWIGVGVAVMMILTWGIPYYKAIR